LFKLDYEILTDALLPQTQSKFLNLSPSLIALFTDEEDIFAAKVLKYEFILLGYKKSYNIVYVKKLRVLNIKRLNII
jgi:hypothetical protein